MSGSDDRDLFEEKKRARAIALARDTGLFDGATELLVAADKYHYSYLWSWMGVPITQTRRTS